MPVDLPGGFKWIKDSIKGAFRMGDTWTFETEVVNAEQDLKVTITGPKAEIMVWAVGNGRVALDSFLTADEIITACLGEGGGGD